MASVLEIIARGKNETSPLFQAVQQGSVTARNTLRELHKEVGEAGKTWQLNASDVAKWGAGFLTAQAALGGLKSVFSTVSAFVGDSVKSFASAEAANAKLTVALQRQGQATPLVKERYAELASEFQRTTKFGDDLHTEMQALLVQVGGVMPSHMKAAQRASQDLAVGLGVDLRSATMLVGKAFAGETGSLARYGIVVDDAKLKTEGAAAVLEAINAQFGGQAQAELDTYTGKIANIANAWDNVKESIGGSIVQYPLLEATLRSLQSRANGVSDAAGQTKLRLSQLIPSLPGTDAQGWLRFLEDYADGMNIVAQHQEQMNRMPPPPMFRAEEGNQLKAASVDLTHFNDTMKQWVKEEKEATQAAEQHAKAMKDLRDKLSGDGAIKSAREYSGVVRELGGVTRLTKEGADQYHKVLDEGIAAFRAQKKEAPVQMYRDWVATLDELNKRGPITKQWLDDIAVKTNIFSEEWKKLDVNLRRGIDTIPGILVDPFKGMKDEMKDVSEEVKDQFAGVIDAVSSAIGGASGTVLSFASGLLDQIVANTKDKMTGLAGWFNSPAGRTTGQALQTGFQSFDVGFSLGGLSSNRGVGTAVGAGSGAATGAMIGTFVMPGIGTGVGAGIGAIAGAIGGWMGSNKKKKEEEAALKDLQAELLETFKGMENLKKVAAEVGVNIDKAFDMKDRKKALATIEQFSKALDDKRTRLEGLQLAQEGLNFKVTTFAEGLKDAKVLTEDQQAAIGRYANFATGVFRQQVKETGDVFGALEALEPTLGGLSDLQKQFGFETKETYQRLINVRDAVHANADVADSIRATTQMMHGFQDAGIMTRDTLISFAKEAVHDFQTLKDREVDSATAMVLMQDELQMLWEGQKKFGTITDEATQELLKQAEAQGIVGEASQSVNAKMLDALIGIKKELENLATIFKTDIPNAARGSANEIARAYDGIRINPIRVPIEYDDPGMPDFSQPSPTEGFAAGGAVPFTPGGRVVRVAERETERIVSDRQLSAILARAITIAGDGGGQPSTIVLPVHIGERHLEDIVVDVSNRGLRNGRVRVPERAVVERTF